MHDCIIIPNFGGFVLQSISTSYDRADHSFSPMRKEVVFNVTLQHNDGLLLESYMQKYAVDYRKAQLMLEEDTEDLKSVLQQERNVPLGIVGAFSLGEEGQIIFSSNDVQSFSLESYGLPAFHFPALSTTEEVSSPAVAESAVRRPARWGFWRIAAASAAAVALFFLLSTPVKEVNQAAYTASFVPTEIVASKVPVMEQPKEEAKETAAPKVAKVVKEEKAVKETKVAEKPAVKPAAPKKGKTYYIVIASFPTEAQAKEFVAGVDRKLCRNVNTVVKDGKYRIYADKYNNRQEAESYLSKLRENPVYKDAWLFITR